MNFEQTLAYLLRLGHETLSLKFGLENTQQLLKALGEPHLTFPKVQIAGTNGKGSTAVMLEAICRAANIRTGLYTSPHLVSITERVRIDGFEITEEEFARKTTQVSEIAQELCAAGTLPNLPTFFEHVTAIALSAFHDAPVELGILETGLGGRLDATTAACAEVVAITTVALDHQAFLGWTINEIASEKAAVIREGVTAVIAPQVRAVEKIILERCAECSVEPILIDHDVPIINSDKRGRVCIDFKLNERVYESVQLNLPGRHQAVNASVALGITEVLIARGFKIPHDAIVNGLETAEHPGRLEWRTGEPSFLFDGAHNAAGAEALRTYLDEFVDRPITLLFGAMRDKELSVMATTLFPVATCIILTVIDNPRSASRASLEELAQQTASGHTVVFANSAAAISAAIEHTSPDGLVCVTGSLYLIGEIQTLLRHQEHANYAT